MGARTWIVGGVAAVAVAAAAWFGVGAVLGEDERDLAGTTARPLLGEGFSIEMPGDPERSVQSVPLPSGAGEVQVVYYVAEGAADGFGVAVTQYPAETAVDLDAAARGAAEAVQGTAVDIEEVIADGSPARDFRIEGGSADGRAVTVFVRLIAAPGRLIQLQYLTEGDTTGAAATFTTFVDSLDLTGAPSPRSSPRP